MALLERPWALLGVVEQRRDKIRPEWEWECELRLNRVWNGKIR